VDGIVRPAILVVENEPYPPPKLFFNAFYIHWLGAPAVREFSGVLPPRYSLTAQMEYFVQGTPTLQRPFADRGRLLAQLDLEFIAILFPGTTEKMDYGSVPPTSLGSSLLWRWTPSFQTVADGGVLRRLTTVNVSFFLETISN
jgi:hypothetical protein